MPKQLRERYDGLTRIEILNGAEHVRFARARSKTSSVVSVSGTLKHPVLGASRSADTLYLVGYDGTVTAPDSVAIHYKRGIDDLQRELIETYAPSLPYGRVIETRKMAASLGRFSAIPTADAMEVMLRFANCNTRGFLAPQSEIGAPPALERLERKIRAENFRWNGHYPFLSKVANGDLVLIPELQGARTSDELWQRVLGFIATKVYAKGAGLGALVKELNVLMLKDAKSLGDFILEVQPAMASAEPQGEALATTAREQSVGDLWEGLEIFLKKKIPFASTIMQQYAGTGGPLSHEGWASILAEAAAREVATAGKRGPKAEGSKKVVKGEVGVRLADNLEALFNGKKVFSLCLHGEAVAQLRLLAGASNNFGVDTHVRNETTRQVKAWVAEATGLKSTVASRFQITVQNLSEEVEFTPDPKRNRTTVRFTGEQCDREFAVRARPTPSPSPAPTAPPTKSTGKGLGDYAKDLWDWATSGW